MQPVDQLDLESLKLVNKIYEMRQFIYAAIFQSEKINDQLSTINPKYIETLTTINTEFKTLFENQQHINYFLKVFLGEEVGKEIYKGGLLKNKAKDFYDFLNQPKNLTIKKFMLDNLSKLEDAWSAWQTYDITHTQLSKLFKECEQEVDKQIIRVNVNALMRENKRSRLQPPIKMPLLYSTNSTRPTPSIVITLENPEEFPCTAKFLRALELHENIRLVKYIKSLLHIYQKIKQLTLIDYLPLLLKLDKLIINLLLHTEEIHLVNYCNHVLETIPDNFVLGKEWLNTNIPPKDKTKIEQYWRQFSELLTAHLQQHPNDHLQSIINKLQGTSPEKDDTESCATQPDIEQIVLSRSLSEEKPDKTTITKENIAPALARRSKSDISANLAQHQRSSFFGRNQCNFQRCNSTSILTTFENNEIPVVSGAPYLKRKRE